VVTFLGLSRNKKVQVLVISKIQRESEIYLSTNQPNCKLTSFIHENMFSKIALVGFWTLLLVGDVVHSWMSLPCRPARRKSLQTHQMGIMDKFFSFMQDRGTDFVRLETDTSVFGPGPALILYQVPTGIANDEVKDMLEDFAPKAAGKGVVISRLSPDLDREFLDQPLGEAIAQIVDGKGPSSSIQNTISTDAGLLGKCPVLLFSGFENDEMMTTYNILGREIYQETGGQGIPAACAKVVPNAMAKPLNQVLGEISADHESAINLTSEEGD
jgi:hypothetical protein